MSRRREMANRCCVCGRAAKWGELTEYGTTDTGSLCLAIEPPESTFAHFDCVDKSKRWPKGTAKAIARLRRKHWEKLMRAQCPVGGRSRRRERRLCA